MRVYERDMRRACGISLAWFDVLIHLWEAPSGTLRMHELADTLLLSRSWLTRRIDGMAAAGLVRRSPAGDDRRGICATLTDQGRQVYKQAARVHARSIHDNFAAHLSAAEAATIEGCFHRLERQARVALSAQERSRRATPPGRTGSDDRTFT